MTGDPRAERVAVFRGIALSWVLIAIWFGGALALSPAPEAAGAAARLALAFRWLIPVGLSLGVAIAMVAAHRNLISGIGGGEVPGDAALTLKLRFLTNTAEQSALALIAYPAFALTAPAATLAVIPAAGTLFLLARIGFYLGYRRGRAVNRSVGFACTFYPTGVMLIAAAVFATL